MSDGSGEERRRAAITVRIDFSKDGFGVVVGDVLRVTGVDGGTGYAAFSSPSKTCSSLAATLQYVNKEITRRTGEIASAAGPGPLFQQRTAAGR